MNINRNIAWTYFIASKKMTLVAILGVVLGISIFMFMNSMAAGFDRTSGESFFKSTPHIRVYKDDKISQPLREGPDSKTLIVNPKVVPSINTIDNPIDWMKLIRKQKDVVVVFPQVSCPVFYNNGKSQITGTTIGFDPVEADKMFRISTFTVQGSITDLSTHQDGIIIGSGIAEKMNLMTGDKINMTSSKGVNLTLTVVGIFKTNNSKEDKTKSYVNLSTGQQFLKEGNSYVTDINVNIDNPDRAPQVAKELTELTGYKAEDWIAANETYMAASRIRKIVITFISFTLLIVSSFGIYNILNMTVSQKINDIAILKAMGFNGGDVIRIFVYQALTIGAIGVILGVMLALILVQALQHVYIGGDIGYFPIRFEPWVFLRGIFIGLFITFLAGYVPAKKAAKVDPVSIFRK
ncbi:MAG: Lipoprotein releasing system transrane protein LolC [Bacteroidota bacterium]|jgi:lipoprotein-releasing system permease protein